MCAINDKIDQFLYKVNKSCESWMETEPEMKTLKPCIVIIMVMVIITHFNSDQVF